jgi:hypothetical protein
MKWAFSPLKPQRLKPRLKTTGNVGAEYPKAGAALQIPTNWDGASTTVKWAIQSEKYELDTQDAILYY